MNNVMYPYPDTALKQSIELKRIALLSATVTYIRDGRDGNLQDRLRIASDMSGIPRKTIEVELTKR